MEAEQRQRSVEAALTQVVGDFGRKVSDDPIRLRNLLIDATGVDAMTLNSEINAVVAAAESQVLGGVTSDDVTEQAEATQRLEATLGPEQAGLAGWATETWTSVLSTSPNRPDAASGGASLGATVLPSASTTGDATVLPSASITEDATVLPGPTTHMPPAAAAGPVGGADGASGGDRRLLLVGGLGALLVLAIVIIVFATRSGGDGEAAPSSTSPAGLADGTAPDARDTATTAPADDTPSVSIGVVDPIVRELQVANGVDGRRSIAPGEGSTTIDLMFTNSSGSAFDGFWLEAAPADFGRGLLDVQDPDVIELGDAQTPVFAVPLALAAGESTTVSYTTNWVPNDESELDAAASGFDSALQGWIERNGDPTTPSLSMTSPATSTEVAYTLSGVTEPMNLVTIDGVDVDVASDGSFVAQAELTPGPNVFELAATSPLGVTVTTPASVGYEPPPVPTDPPATDPPVNAAPVLQCTDDYVEFEGAFEGYIFSVPLECFADPEGAELVYYSSIGVGAPPDQCPVGEVCWVYSVPEGWDGTPFEIVAEIWAEDPEGLRSESGSLTMCLNCTP